MDISLMQWTRIRLFLFLVTLSWKFWLDSVVLHLLIHLENCQWGSRWIPWPPELISAIVFCLYTMPLASLSSFCYLITSGVSLAREYPFIGEMQACFPTPSSTGMILLGIRRELEKLLWIVTNEPSRKFCR